MSAKGKIQNTKQSPRNHDAEPEIVVHGQASRLLMFHEVGPTLRACRSLKDAIEWSGMTFQEFGAALAATPECARDYPYSKSYLSLMSSGRKRMQSQHRAGVARVLTDRVHQLTGETIGVSVTINSPMVIRLWRVCGEHGTFELKRITWINCPVCGKKC